MHTSHTQTDQGCRSLTKILATWNILPLGLHEPLSPSDLDEGVRGLFPKNGFIPEGLELHLG